ncbi:unnamed protein product [Schistocephalus solidus]|uniref:G_PROTEIN_RECEP_F1_2 domain-containing protein n=1 Tax=Schistocephalus solidus TaxID=70667 RepID=A0A183SF59_SCHSO|nr:unnamed protein product [Schistocephalus solidus]
MSKAYWKCHAAEPQHDALSVISTIINILCLVLNCAMLVFVFLLNGRPRFFLVHLRALTAAVVIFCFIKIFHYVIPSRIINADLTIAPILCHLWTSRYIFFVAYTFVMLILNFIVGNRAIQIVWKYQYSFSTSLLSELASVSVICGISIISMIPQTFIVQWDGTQCKCLDTSLPYGKLVSLYTQTFVHFGLTVVFSFINLSLSCYKIFYWVRHTPPEQLSDTWNILALPGTTKEQMEAFSRPQGWMTATLCTVPLSVNFLTLNIIKTWHTFVCALGLCTIIINSPIVRVGVLLSDLQLVILPTIFAIYLPALRDLSVRVCQKLSSLSRRLCNLPCKSASTEQQPIQNQ